MKLSHKKLIVLSGLVWLTLGIYLLQLGLGFIFGDLDISVGEESSMPVARAVAPYVGGIEVAALLMVAIGIYIGYFKGRYVLGKSAKRGVDRILSFENPAPLKYIYSPKYYVLIAAMILLGMSVKFMGLSNDIRGMVDVIIGSALVNGAMIYFRLAQETKANG